MGGVIGFICGCFFGSFLGFIIAGLMFLSKYDIQNIYEK